MTEVVDRRHVGAALTIELAAGFVLTVFTIFWVPGCVTRTAGAFVRLASGPLLGAWAMRALRLGPLRDPAPPREPASVSALF